jgi:hypothetical protein
MTIAGVDDRVTEPESSLLMQLVGEKGRESFAESGELTPSITR